MSHDGLPTRAATGARAADADRLETGPRRATRSTTHRRHLGVIAGIGAASLIAVAACSGGPGSTSSTGSSTPLASTDAGPSAEASLEPSATAASSINISFQEANASKIFGGGIMTDLGDGSTAVTIGVVAIGFTDPMPASIESGACADVMAAPVPSAMPVPSADASGGASSAPSAAASMVAPSADASAGAGASAEASGLTESTAPTPATLPAPLTDVAAGSSNTVVQLRLADLLASPSAVVLRKSAADLTVVACADVTSTPVVPSVPALPSDLPSMPALPSDLPSLPALPSSSP